ncbi:Uncharacterised protein [Mycobacteroides abscessus subsp. abscessus]|uniref:hypothetical protein n=1 Tax=Mycobacteroides abscessus TaxID=36809 RepID=UPI000929C484|nr:hypothetical protein [Mycobacteroides abscessus]SHX56799.1 Uncharacterised protein [Mycobacteroides abscessus subsp. abscessus]SHY08807.1 Uncharacterised protein [Mycobacteroides abscessus subsp. abscessus]SIC44619.1 Uncharacterised protein [Mycobacteroides abscessus subsp. abscessus]SID66523.1 Uncharacterised protein [Mycobacteroides abscessus subsp. abscessus]SIF01302.1 Uncharacterised protein [Mycobacteroides abscessus subsp. abscessus]
MTDPAVEAARRADSWEPDIKQPDKFGEMVTAAREALRPIRDIHQKWAEAYAYRADGLVLNAFLAALAPLIFTTEELEQ